MVRSVAAVAAVLNPRIDATPTVVRYLESIFIVNIPHFIFRYFTFLLLFYYFIFAWFNALLQLQKLLKLDQKFMLVFQRPPNSQSLLGREHSVTRIANFY